MITYHKMKKNAGLSMLELLITLGIFMLVLIPVFNTFDKNYKSYLVQTDVAEVQQNIRVAMTFIQRDIRIAGAGLDALEVSTEIWEVLDKMGLADTVKDSASEEVGSKVYGMSFENGTGDNGSDKLHVLYSDPFSGPCGTGMKNGLNPCDQLPPLNLSSNKNDKEAKGNEGSVSNINQDFSLPPYDEWTKGCYCDDAEYDKGGGGGPPYGFMGIITSPDGSMSDLVIVTQVISGQQDKLQNHPVNDIGKYPGYDEATDGVGYDNKVLNEFPSGSRFSFFSLDFFQGVSYFLQDDTLMRQIGDDSPQPLAEDIEDLQFALYGDFDGDGSVDTTTDCASNDDCINDESLTPASDNAEDIDKITLVRVNILARTSKEHGDLAPMAQPAIEDHDPEAEPDGYHRRLLVQEIKPRNLGQKKEE